jgi:hypothetical protein
MIDESTLAVADPIYNGKWREAEGIDVPSTTLSAAVKEYTALIIVVAYFDDVR